MTTYADVVFARVEREMRDSQPPRVKLIYTDQGVFTSAKLQEQAKYFLTRTAQGINREEATNGNQRLHD